MPAVAAALPSGPGTLLERQALDQLHPSPRHLEAAHDQGLAFAGDEVAEVLAAVIESEPDWSLLPLGAERIMARPGSFAF